MAHGIQTGGPIMAEGHGALQPCGGGVLQLLLGTARALLWKIPLVEEVLMLKGAAVVIFASAAVVAARGAFAGATSLTSRSAPCASRRPTTGPTAAPYRLGAVASVARTLHATGRLIKQSWWLQTIPATCLPLREVGCARGDARQTSLTLSCACSNAGPRG